MATLKLDLREAKVKDGKKSESDQSWLENPEAGVHVGRGSAVGTDGSDKSGSSDLPDSS